MKRKQSIKEVRKEEKKKREQKTENRMNIKN